jgi:hypothetical protein
MALAVIGCNQVKPLILGARYLKGLAEWEGLASGFSEQNPPEPDPRSVVRSQSIFREWINLVRIVVWDRFFRHIGPKIRDLT